MEKFGFNNGEKPKKKKNTLGYVAALFAAGAGGVALNNSFNNKDTTEITTNDATVITEDDMRRETGVKESLVNEDGETVIDLSKIDSFNGTLDVILYDRDQRMKELTETEENYIAGAHNILTKEEKDTLFKPGTKSLKLIANLLGVAEEEAVGMREEFEDGLYAFGVPIPIKNN